MHQSHTAFIEDFCVDRDYQRRAIGKTLYKEAIKRANKFFSTP